MKTIKSVELMQNKGFQGLMQNMLVLPAAILVLLISKNLFNFFNKSLKLIYKFFFILVGKLFRFLKLLTAKVTEV